MESKTETNADKNWLKSLADVCKQIQTIIAFSVLLLSGLVVLWGWINFKSHFDDPVFQTEFEGVAKTDGIITAWAEISATGHVNLIGWVDTKAIARSVADGRVRYCSVSFPVRKDHKWKIEEEVPAEVREIKIWWTPMK